MAVLYIAAGINHFVNPKFYLKIIPPMLPSPTWINWISGAAEVILGLMLLIPTLQSMAAWGIILLLITVFPANIYHFQKDWRKKKMVWILALRLPMQGLLIWWAYTFV
jgi:uncharacterized membrane protein